MSDWHNGWQQWQEITKTEFNRLAKAAEFRHGPLLDSFGDGPGEPYMPDRQAFGILRDGRKVRAWVRGRKVVLDA